MLGPVDRRAGAIAWGIAVCAVLPIVALTRAPVPDATVRHDPVAAAELVGLVQQRDAGRWLVEYDFDRERADGGHFRERVVEVRSPLLHVVAGGTGVTAEFATRTYTCTIVEDAPQCLTSDTGAALSRADLYEVAFARSAYAASRMPEQTIAGERASCYAVASRGPVLSALGLVSQECYADDGVPLFSGVVRAAATDRRLAVRVEREVDREAVVALVVPFGIPSSAVP